MSTAVSSRPYLHVLEAVLQQLTYVNEEPAYTIARMATGRGSDLLTAVGAYRVGGWWLSTLPKDRGSVDRWCVSVTPGRGRCSPASV